MGVAILPETELLAITLLLFQLWFNQVIRLKNMVATNGWHHVGQPFS